MSHPQRKPTEGGTELTQEEKQEPEQEQEQCKPTPNLAWGPIWFPGHKLLKGRNPKICRGEDDGNVTMATTILSRSDVNVGSVKLHLSGQVLDEDCKLIKNAIVDFWSPDSKGRYSLTADGECRGAVKTDGNGRYSVITHFPGSYGVTSGCGYSLYGTELPPFALRHINVAIFSKGHKVIATQLTFPNDVARNYDYREFLAPDNLSDPELELEINDRADGSHEANWNFVIEKDSSVTENLFYNTDALKDIVCLADGFDLGEPYPLCQANTTLGNIISIDGVTTLLLPAIFYVVPMLLILVIILLLGCVAVIIGSSASSSFDQKVKSS